MPSTKQSKKVLVTGGLGFIGSHTVTDLHSKGYTPIIVDNLDNSYIKTLGNLEEICGEKLRFYNGDCNNKDVLRSIAEKEGPIWGCIHFAAYKAVGESVENPLKYYRNNIGTLVSLLEESKNLGFEKFVFSSSCTVYGQPDTLPVDETAPIKIAESPYGYTKQVCERIISDFTATDSPIDFTLLRYFNPIGAHPSAKIGEWPIGTPNNLVPFITQSAIGKRGALQVYGDDYDTKDGSCIRDYIHVMDLAAAHILALDNTDKKPLHTYNVGTGNGSSVLEVIKAFEAVSNVKLDYAIVGRRSGDVEKVFADPTKIKTELGWKPQYSLQDSLLHAWQWEQALSEN
jgi:UDP-glucose 4-epimerase